MNKIECIQEKFSNRAIGLIALGIGLLMALAGTLLLPVFGFFFSLPVLMIASVLIAAPESRVCKMLIR